MAPKKSAQADVGTPAQLSSAASRPKNVSKEAQSSLAPWTYEQETALLKGIVKWKPVGMHKHFRIIAIHNYMIDQGVVSPGDERTTISGLWKKLESLYNLPNLDEREDSMLHSSSDENGSPGEPYYPFDLPDREYGGLKFDKRINLDGSKSPGLLNSRRASTTVDTDEPASSPAPGRRGGRTTRRGGRISKLQQEAESSRRTSKAASMTEDEQIEDIGREEGEDEAGSDAADEDEAVEAVKARSSARSRRTIKGKGSRGRSATRNRGRRK